MFAFIKLIDSINSFKNTCMRHSVNKFSFFLVITFLVFIGCAPKLNVHTVCDKKADFSKYNSFSLYGFTDKTGGISELNRNIINTSVKNEMMSHGYLENEKKPDVLVNIVAIVKEKSKVSSTNYYGYGGVYRPYYWGPGNDTTEITKVKFNEGSLIIDIIDASTKQLIWEGIGNSEIDVPLKKPDSFISEAVKKILSSLPKAGKSK